MHRIGVPTVFEAELYFLGAVLVNRKVDEKSFKISKNAVNSMFAGMAAQLSQKVRCSHESLSTLTTVVYNGSANVVQSCRDTVSILLHRGNGVSSLEPKELIVNFSILLGLVEVDASAEEL